jgi:DNA polymerase-3 subunit gamma/tau
LLPKQIFEQMQSILKQETIAADPAAIKLLARAADGSMRDGLSLLDQAIVYGGGKVAMDDVQSMLGVVAQKPVEQLLTALGASDGNAILKTIEEIADLQPDFSAVLEQLIQVLHRIALAQYIPSIIDPEFDSEMIAAFAGKMAPEDVQLYYQIALHGQKDLDLAPDTRMGFEMVMLRMLAFKPHEMSSETKSVKFDGTGEKKVKQVSSPVQVSAADPDISNKPSTDITALNMPLEGENWIDIIGKMGLESVTRELANNCVLVSIDSQSCKLHLAAAYQHLLSPARQQKLQKALQDYAGKPLKLTIAAVDAPIETPAVQTAKAEEERQRAAVEAINSDANIQALKEHFDARILPGTIEPV